MCIDQRGDRAAYQGYQTRFFRDTKGNVVQIYLDARSGRVVNLLADALNESVGFTVRDSSGKPVPSGRPWRPWSCDARECALGP